MQKAQNAGGPLVSFRFLAWIQQDIRPLPEKQIFLRSREAMINFPSRRVRAGTQYLFPLLLL
jgi:hypothetical protein